MSQESVKVADLAQSKYVKAVKDFQQKDKTKPKYVKVAKTDNQATKEVVVAKADTQATKEVVVAKADTQATKEVVVAKADTQATKEVVSKKVKVYGTYVSVPAKYASTIIGSKAVIIKGIEKEVGNSTRLYYETEKEAVSITSCDKKSLKEASLKILSLLDEAKKKEASKKPVIKKVNDIFNIHPDILKANLVYQVIGPKGSYIHEMTNTVGRGCNIICNQDGKYEVEAESKKGLNIAYDLLMKRERIILTNPYNKERIDRSRGYRLIKNKKGQRTIEYIGQEHSLIDIYRKKETVRYWLSKNNNIPLYEVEEKDIEEEYERFYNDNQDKKEAKTFNLEQLKEEMKGTPVTIPAKEIKTIWNNSDKVQTIKDELPEITERLNILHHKLNKKRLETLEDSLVILDISDIMDSDYDEDEDTEEESENLPEFMYNVEEKEEESDNLPEFIYNVEELEELEEENYYEEYESDEENYYEEPYMSRMTRMSDAKDN
jgi:hypothetical protein